VAELTARLAAGGGEHKLASLDSAAAVLTDMKAGGAEFVALEKEVKLSLNGLIEVRRLMLRLQFD
jgi:hypothetical protein